MSLIVKNLKTLTSVLEPEKKYDITDLIEDVKLHTKTEFDKLKSQLSDINTYISVEREYKVFDKMIPLRYFYENIDRQINDLSNEIESDFNKNKIDLPQSTQFQILKNYLQCLIETNDFSLPIWFEHYQSSFLKNGSVHTHKISKHNIIIHYNTNTNILRIIHVDVPSFKIQPFSNWIFVLRKNVITIYDDEINYTTHISLKKLYTDIKIDFDNDNKICVYNHDLLQDNHRCWYNGKPSPCTGEIYDNHGRFIKETHFTSF